MTQREHNLGADPSEARLLQAAARGDGEAFQALFGRYQGGLYRFALRMSGQAAVADDVVQEVFLAVIGGRHGYRAEAGKVGPFLYGMTRNLVRRALRATWEPAEEQEARADESDPLEGLARAERTGRVRQAVLSLPVHYREVITLCDLEEMSYDEASEVLSCAVGTVRSRLHRGRELLLVKLQEARCPA